MCTELNRIWCDVPIPNYVESGAVSIPPQWWKEVSLQPKQSQKFLRIINLESNGVLVLA